MKKNLFTLLTALVAVVMLFAACKKETTNDDPQTTNSELVGTWLSNENSLKTQTNTNVITGDVTKDEYSLKGWKVTFRADGTCSEGSWKLEGSKLTIDCYSEVKVFDVLKLDDKTLIIEQKSVQEIGDNRLEIKTHYELDKQ